MTTANKITILRIILIPFFVVEMIYYVRTGNEIHRLLAILSFGITAISDAVDGYIARTYKQISELGKILDPLADKLLLVSAIVMLSFNNEPYLRQIPLWLTGLVIGRDLLLGIGAVVIRTVVGKISVRPRFSGKLATVFQMLVIIWILLRWEHVSNGLIFKILILGAGIFTAVSFFYYVFDGMKQLSAHPSSSPSPRGGDDTNFIFNSKNRSKLFSMAKELTLKEGDVAPDFSAATSGGGKISLADYKGQNVILYFYPKDDTPGCAKQACGLRDQFAEFKNRNAVVLGVSTDSASSHDKFVEKFKLPFPLLADEDKKIVQAYGVWGEKSFLGRKYTGTNRVTFLIGGDGRIKKIWPKVKPDTHAEEILAAL
jgi:CDP-diacylglycerol--glycerol-3-phosphate 3-phosphatidyltransferase